MDKLRIIIDLMPTEWQRQGYLIPPKLGDEMWETVKEMRFKPPEQTDEDKQRDEMYTGSNCGDG